MRHQQHRRFARSKHPKFFTTAPIHRSGMRCNCRILGDLSRARLQAPPPVWFRIRCRTRVLEHRAKADMYSVRWGARAPAGVSMTRLWSAQRRSTQMSLEFDFSALRTTMLFARIQGQALHPLQPCPHAWRTPRYKSGTAASVTRDVRASNRVHNRKVLASLPCEDRKTGKTGRWQSLEPN